MTMAELHGRGERIKYLYADQPKDKQIPRTYEYTGYNLSSSHINCMQGIAKYIGFNGLYEASL